MRGEEIEEKTLQNEDVPPTGDHMLFSDSRSERSSGQSERINSDGHDRAMRRLTLALVWWTFALVIVGTIAAIVTYNQFLIMRAQLREMQGSSQQTDRSIKQATRLADISQGALAQSARLVASMEKQSRASIEIAENNKQQLNTARDQEENQLRAYVDVISCSADDFSIGSIPRFFVEYKNPGASPASAFSGSASVYAIAKGASFAQIKSSDTTFRTLAAGTDGLTSVSTGSRVTEDLFDAVKSGAIQIILQGTFSYRDVLGSVHHTTFRYIYSGEASLSRGEFYAASAGTRQTEERRKNRTDEPHT